MSKYDDQITDIIQDISDCVTEHHLATSPYAKVKPFPPGPNTHWGKGDSFADAAKIKLEELRNQINNDEQPPSQALPGNTFVTRLATGTVAAGGDLTRYGVVALNAGDYALAKTLRAAGVVTLVYKCMSSTRSWDKYTDTSGGVAYPTALASWFATKGGARIEWAGQDPGHWQMDIASPAYQTEWIKQVLANLDEHFGSWDGVIVDNANVDPSGYASFPWDRYTDWQTYRDATRNFLATVAPAITSAGWLFVPNIQHHGSKLTEALWRDWVQFCSGGHLEHYTKWGDGTDRHILGAGWDASGQAFLRASQEMGKMFLGTFACPITDTRSMNYARGSFLIDWDGGSDSALGYEPNPLAQDPYSPVWTKDIGLPLGPKVATAAGYTRAFERGTVTLDKVAGTAVIG